MRRLPDVSDGWAEGRYMDLWMVVHFLSGAVGGFGNVFFRLRGVTVALIGALVMVLWEVLEYMLGIREHWINRALDVGVGMAGLMLALLIARFIGPVAESWFFGVTWAIALALMALGIRARRRRKR